LVQPELNGTLPCFYMLVDEALTSASVCLTAPLNPACLDEGTAGRESSVQESDGKYRRAGTPTAVATGPREAKPQQQGWRLPVLLCLDERHECWDFGNWGMVSRDLSDPGSASVPKKRPKLGV